MQLQERLDELKRGFLASGRITKEMLEIMQRSTDQLRPVAQERPLKARQTAPAFDLLNQDEQPVSSSSLLKKGPLVVSYFRGVW